MLQTRSISEAHQGDSRKKIRKSLWVFAARRTRGFAAMQDKRFCLIFPMARAWIEDPLVAQGRHCQQPARQKFGCSWSVCRPDQLEALNNLVPEYVSCIER
jgi:hypothetical protein